MKKLFNAGLILLTVWSCFAFAVAAYGGEKKSKTEEFQFLLGPGDILEISVWGDEALNKQVMVRPDGNISFPLIGDVKVKGLGVEALRREIEKRIKEYVPDSPVTVMLMQLASPKVFVVGKVARPGMYVMNDRMRVMQMLAMAGGLTPFADSGGILIIRETEGGQKVMEFSYDKVEDGKDLSQNIVLLPGDTIIVP